MKSYYYEGKGLSAFLEKTEEVKEIIAHNLMLEHGGNVPPNVLCYLHLIDYVRDHAERLFEYEPAMLFEIKLFGSPKKLLIRIKDIKQEVVTILTVYFSSSFAKTEAHCKESLEWSRKAFYYIFKSEP